MRPPERWISNAEDNICAVAIMCRVIGCPDWNAPTAAAGRYVLDGSILPSSIGVNSQLPIMGVTMMLARGLCDDWERVARRAAWA